MPEYEVESYPINVSREPSFVFTPSCAVLEYGKAILSSMDNPPLISTYMLRHLDDLFLEDAIYVLIYIADSVLSTDKGLGKHNSL